MKVVSELKGKDKDLLKGFLVSRELFARLKTDRTPGVSPAPSHCSGRASLPSSDMESMSRHSRNRAITDSVNSTFQYRKLLARCGMLDTTPRCVSSMDRRGKRRNCLFYAGLGSSGRRQWV